MSMSPSQCDDHGGRIGVRVPSNYSTAVDQIQNELNYHAGAHDNVTKSDVVRMSLEVLFQELDQLGVLPEETRDLMDDYLLANAGDEELALPGVRHQAIRNVVESNGGEN